MLGKLFNKRALVMFGTGVVTILLAIIIISLVRSEDVLKIASRNVDTITINATYCDKTKTLTAHQTIEYRNRTSHPKGEVKFHIFANAFRERECGTMSAISKYDVAQAFPNGKSFGHIEITSVAINGNPKVVIVGGTDDHLLIVHMPNPLRTNQSVTIEINYVVHLANIAHRLGWTDRVVNLGNFYPVPVIFQDGEWMDNVYSYKGDPFFNAMHNFNVTLTKPANFIMASSGTLIRSRTSDDTRTTTVRSLAIRDWAAVLSPYFQSISRVTNRVTVSYYFLDDDTPHRSLETSVKALNTFSRLFAKYPYRQLAVVQTDFLHGGMEYGEIVFIASSITDREEKDRVIIHEIAHQWWYGIIGNDQVREAWIDEGLAEYSTLLFYDENPGFLSKPRHDYINLFRSNLANFMRLVHGVGGTVNQQMNRPLDAFASVYEYLYMTYVRGMLLFADLETLIGRDNMIYSLRKLATENLFGIVTENIVIDTFERASGARLELFFRAFLQGN